MAKSGSINKRNLITMISLAILVGTELIGVSLAAGWAIAGYFGLNGTIATILMTAFGALSLYALMIFMQRAIKMEPIRN